MPVWRTWMDLDRLPPRKKGAKWAWSDGLRRSARGHRRCPRSFDFAQRPGDFDRAQVPLSVHQRIRFRGTPRQNLRPHLRCRRRCLPDGGTRGPGRRRNPVHDQPGRPRRRGARSRPPHPRRHRGRGPRRDQGDRIRTGRVPLAKGRGAGPCACPVVGHRPGRRRRRQQGRGRRRPGHHVRLCVPRNLRPDARPDPIFPRHLALPSPRPAIRAPSPASAPTPRAR